MKNIRLFWHAPVGQKVDRETEFLVGGSQSVSTRFFAKILLVLFGLSSGAGTALAADIPDDYALRGATQASDLEFPKEVSDIDFVSEPQMALYKPKGDGPFPALVLFHQCGGLVGQESMLEWARQAVKRGYVVLQVDALSQRGVRSVCKGPTKAKVYFSRGARDAFQAAAYVRALPYVDKRRVAIAGFSWGGGVALLTASGWTADKLDLSERYDAVVSFYPPCHAFPSNGQPPYSNVTAGIDRPLLVLLGGKDTETPADHCVASLELQKKSGAPAQWHTYPEATHCWDCSHLDGRTKNGHWGEVVYTYDAAVTKDSAERMFGFFENAFTSAK